MRRLANYFLRGLLITAPVVVTFYLCWVAIRWVDALMGIRVPGLGLALVIASVTLIGAAASNLVTKSFIATVDRALERLPFVRLVYASVRDLFSAFVGEKRRFNRPVRARIGEGEAAVYVLGFVTADSLEHLGLPGHVAVYVPYSYSVAGHLIVLPADRVTPIATDAADTMAFIVSGGIARSVKEAGGRRQEG